MASIFKETHVIKFYSINIKQPGSWLTINTRLPNKLSEQIKKTARIELCKPFEAHSTKRPSPRLPSQNRLDRCAFIPILHGGLIFVDEIGDIEFLQWRLTLAVLVDRTERHPNTGRFMDISEISSRGRLQ